MAVVSFLVATTGVVPNPAVLIKAATGASGERYPCEHGRCMCASARECWTTCQCHSLKQKVAWAEREGVEVPSYVDLSELASSPERAPGCPLCALDEGGIDQELCGAPAPAEQNEDEAGEPSPVMPSLTAAGCKGIQLLLAFGAVVTITPAPVEVVMCEPSMTLFGVAEAQRGAWASIDVPTPPPRSLRA